MFYRNGGNLLSADGSKEKTLQMSELTLVLDNVVPNIFADYPVAAGFHFFRFANQDADSLIIDPAAKVAKTTVLLIFIISENNIIALLAFCEKLVELGTVRLTVIIH